jgi:tol-pal system beta propeller repeat protein TolB
LTFLLVLTIAGCNLPASTSTPDLFATLQASTPLGVTPAAPTNVPPTVQFFTPNPEQPQTDITPLPRTPITNNGSIPAPTASDGLTGHIVFTCQVFKTQFADQVCIMNADGSDYRRLTTKTDVRNFYPSLSPDGRSVIYSRFRQQNIIEIIEHRLADGDEHRLTDKLGIATAPDISPDGKSIVFMLWTADKEQYEVWVMDRDGSDPHRIRKIVGWDPSWSPNGQQILFAATDPSDGTNQLFVMDANGANKTRVSSLPSIRGRSDWSPDGSQIVTYSGEAWKRNVFIMNADGSGSHRLSPDGGNAQGPSFSPDGKWVVFTAYYDLYGDDHGCEIYVIRTDGTDLRRLTNNDYCDYQPRWGP